MEEVVRRSKTDEDEAVAVRRWAESWRRRARKDGESTHSQREEEQ